MRTDSCNDTFFQQSQLDDKDRTIRIQQDLIQKLEAEKNCASPPRDTLEEQNIERTNMATQTDRVNMHNFVKELKDGEHALIDYLFLVSGATAVYEFRWIE